MTLQMYSKHITDNASLTSRLLWKTSTFNGLMASIGYRYQFGRHMGMSKLFVEIAADGNFRQMITFPVLGNMICKFVLRLIISYHLRYYYICSNVYLYTFIFIYRHFNKDNFRINLDFN